MGNMNKLKYNEYKVNFLSNVIENKRYSAKRYVKKGEIVTHVVLEDKRRKKDVIGKVGAFTEGEIFHWPRLNHQNLAPLLDVISTDAKVNILISTYIEKNLREIIHDGNFVNNPSCFTNKKIYMENILCGLHYLHENSLVHMNISDANIYICLKSNTAVITDFRCLKSICHAKKSKLPLPLFYQAPEMSETNNARDKYHAFNPIAAEMWAFGIVALEVFLQHKVPWGLVDYNCSRALEIINYVDLATLKAANKQSTINQEDLTSFKEFLNLFLSHHPYNRSGAGRATSAIFLQNSMQKIAQDISKSCHQQRKGRIDSKVRRDSFIRLSPSLSTKSSPKMFKRCNQPRIKCTDANVEGDSSVGGNHPISPNIPSASKHLSLKFSVPKCENTVKDIDLNADLSLKSSREFLPVAQSFSEKESICRIKDIPSRRKVYSFIYRNREKSLQKMRSDEVLTQQITENITSRENLQSVNQQQNSTESNKFIQRIERMRSPVILTREYDLDRSRSENFKNKIEKNKIRSSHRIRELDLERSKSESFFPIETYKSMSSHETLVSELNLDTSRKNSFENSPKDKKKGIQSFKSSYLSLSNENNNYLSEVPGKEVLESVKISPSRICCSRSKSLFFETSDRKSDKAYNSVLNLHSSKRDSKNHNSMKESTTSVQSAPFLSELKSSLNNKNSFISTSKFNIKRRKSVKRWKCLVENENRQNEAHGHENQLPVKDNQCRNSNQNEEGTILGSQVCKNLSPVIEGKYKKLPGTNAIEDSHCIFRDKFRCPVHGTNGLSDNFQRRRETKDQNGQSVKWSKEHVNLHLYKSGRLSNCYYSQIGENNNNSPNSKTKLSWDKSMYSFDSGNSKYSKKHASERDVKSDCKVSDQLLEEECTLKRPPSVDLIGKKVVRRRRFIRIEVVWQKGKRIQESEKQTMDIGTRKVKNTKLLKDCSKQKKVKCQKLKTDKKINLSPNSEKNTLHQTVISRRSVAVLTSASPNNPMVPTLTDKHKEKRNSLKNLTLHCLCLRCL